MKEENSEVRELSKHDLRKVARGLGIALCGAALTYFTEVITQINLGAWTPVVVAGWSAFVNAARLYMTDHNK